MNKLKHAFFNTKSEDKRTSQFLKMQTQAPFIGLSDLTEKEKPVYASWWKDLDPFGLDLISNEKILNFLKKCCLEDSKLEEILLLFETARDGLNKGQFFAMLRLIAHAQNGRNISRALIYIGAPIPIIIHYEHQQQHQQQQQYVDTIFTVNNDVSNSHNFMNKWWDQTNATNIYNQQQDQWHQKQQPQQQIIENNSHTRSRSATTPEPTTGQQGVLPSSFSLYNLTDDRGQSLLLTKAFVYQSPATRNQELQKEQQRREEEQQHQHQQKVQQLQNNKSNVELENPFYDSEDDDDDDDSDDTLDSPFTDDYYTTNIKVNSYRIPPPPVPAQSTKPAFLKYTRNNSFPKRSQSTKDNHSKKHVYQHQRHKSIPSTSYSHYLK